MPKPKVPKKILDDNKATPNDNLKSKKTPNKKVKDNKDKLKGGLRDDIESEEDEYISDTDTDSDNDGEKSEQHAEENMDEVDNDDALDNGAEVEDEDEKDDKEDDDDEVASKGDGDEDCMYQFTKNKNIDADDIVTEEDNFDDEEDIIANKNASIVPPDQRTTKPFLFKYERVRLLGDRARQLSLGAKPMLTGVTTIDPKELARLELKHGVIPLLIKRPLPNGMSEVWKVSELKILE